tara:strand:+ start:608 stop:895 length:288 start_codon:yes stop_codon:yes gene_type:complete
MNEEIQRLTMENEALAERTSSLLSKVDSIMGTISSLETELEVATNKLWKLEEELGTSSNIEDTLRVNEIDSWTINHKTISTKIEERILAKLKGLE